MWPPSSSTESQEHNNVTLHKMFQRLVGKWKGTISVCCSCTCVSPGTAVHTHTSEDRISNSKQQQLNTANIAKLALGPDTDEDMYDQWHMMTKKSWLHPKRTEHWGQKTKQTKRCAQSSECDDTTDTTSTHVCRHFGTVKTDECRNTRLDQYTGDKSAIHKMSSLLGHDRCEQLVLLWTACRTKTTHTDKRLTQTNNFSSRGPWLNQRLWCIKWWWQSSESHISIKRRVTKRFTSLRFLQHAMKQTHRNQHMTRLVILWYIFKTKGQLTHSQFV